MVRTPAAQSATETIQAADTTESCHTASRHTNHAKPSSAVEPWQSSSAPARTSPTRRPPVRRSLIFYSKKIGEATADGGSRIDDNKPQPAASTYGTTSRNGRTTRKPSTTATNWPKRRNRPSRTTKRLPEGQQPVLQHTPTGEYVETYVQMLQTYDEYKAQGQRVQQRQHQRIGRHDHLPQNPSGPNCLCSINCCGFSHDDFSGLGRACRPRNGLNWMVLVSPPERTGKDYDQHAPSTVYPSFAAERGIRRVDRAENTCQRADGA